MKIHNSLYHSPFYQDKTDVHPRVAILKIKRRFYSHVLLPTNERILTVSPRNLLTVQPAM